MPLGHEHPLTRFHPEFIRLARPINLILAANGACRFPYWAVAFQVYARGGFSSGAPKGDSQSMIASPWWELARLLVPVIAFSSIKLALL
jgi:hypothetical protein